MLDLIAALSALARQVLLPIEATVPAILAFGKSGWLGAFVVAAVIKPKAATTTNLNYLSLRPTLLSPIP